MVASLDPRETLDDTAELLTKFVLDWIGATAGGATVAESASAMFTALCGQAGRGDTVVLGSAATYPAQDGALLNGTFAHSLELDDTYLPGRLHPGAPCIAAGLATGQSLGSSGPEFLTSLLAGYEVSCRLSAALGPGMFSRGLHPTGVAGTFGATATVGQLMGLDVERLVSAFGLAASMASGSTQYLHSGSWNKRLHAGLAARNGILAATLAEAGIVGATEALEGEHGVLHAFSDHSEAAPLTDDLGQRWETLEMGIKPYPSCRLTHGSIDASLEMRRRLSGRIPDGAEFTVRINPDDATIVAGDALNKIEPRNTVEGQFSVYFQIAAALLHGRPDWTVYQLLGDPTIEGLTHRIRAVPDPDIPEAGAILTVQGAGLDDDSVRIDAPSGEPAAELAWTVVEGKYRSLAGYVYDDDGLDRIVDAVRRLSTTGGVRELAHTLRVNGTTASSEMERTA